MRRAFERSGAAPVSARTAFNIFREHGISVDLISTSESNVTVSIDTAQNVTTRRGCECARAAQPVNRSISIARRKFLLFARAVL